jgi:hypothetical protein
MLRNKDTLPPLITLPALSDNSDRSLIVDKGLRHAYRLFKPSPLFVTNGPNSG